MQEKITREVFDRLADLAALALNDEESEYLREQMNHQIQAIEELVRIDIPEGVAFTAHGVKYTEAISQPPRADEAGARFPKEEILKQVPEVADGWIVVPDISSEAME